MYLHILPWYSFQASSWRQTLSDSHSLTLLLYDLEEHLHKDEKNPSTAVFSNFVHNIKT